MRYLGAVYRDVYGEIYTASEYKSRKKMNAAVYLLQEFGLNFTDDGYGFSISKNGMWSQTLMEDAAKTSLDLGVMYSEYTEKTIERLRTILKVPYEFVDVYDVSDWGTCISQAYHILKYVVHRKSKDEAIDHFRKLKNGYCDMKLIDNAITVANTLMKM